MKLSVILGALAAAASATTDLTVRGDDKGHGNGYGGGKGKKLVNSAKLQAAITQEKLLAGSKTLLSFAEKYPGRTRITGSNGHSDTINWLKTELESLGGYYDVSLQEFFTVVMVSGAINTFTVDGEAVEALLFDFSGSGNVTAPLVVVNNLGCEASDYPPEVEGKIALILRGTCNFGLKSALAGSAGAAGALIYNNAPGTIQGTLGAPPRPEGPYVATLSLSQEQGLAYVNAIAGGATVTATLDVATEVKNASTFNVLATTKGGDQQNRLALGAHTDSVLAGPGINDDGSGVVGVLEVAKALSKYEVKNAVTFGFWSGEEIGLLGSAFYVASLSAAEQAKIRGYLNFDMIASPNYIHAIYDGDGGAFNLTGPAGSAEFEKFLEDYFTAAGQNFTATAFDGRSDYGPFLDAGIPSGGTFTGAEELKTEEEVERFGGEAGVALDACYHAACDDVDNLALDAFELHSKAIAAAVAKYARSWEGFPARNTTATKRSLIKGRDNIHHSNKRGCAKHVTH